MTGLGGIHATECWTPRVRSRGGRREELASTRRQLLLTENARLDLIRLSENRDSGPLTTTSPRETP